MSGKDHVLAINEEGIGKAKLEDAVGDLSDLFFRMGPRIAGVGAPL